MQQIQLYIEGQRVDMFQDESVSITDTIKNVKDVSKVFTEYSQTFKVPASKINNKIFKHYYNNDITNGYDSRIMVSANIELNQLPYKEGYIKLEGVDLVNQKAHTYKITFFGNTVTLKNSIGDDFLADLSWLDNLSTDLTYDKDSVFDYLTLKKNKEIDGVVYESPLQIPLLTHTQRLYYDSNDHENNTGNLHYTNGHNHGVRWDELKFSVKVLLIIKAIEKKYTISNGYANNIVFSDDFFNNDNNEINNLYMWLHRNKGKFTNGLQLNEYSTNVEFDYKYNEYDDGNVFIEQQGGVLTIYDPDVLSSNRKISVRIEPTETQTYSFRIDRNDGSGTKVTVYESGGITGIGTWSEQVTDSVLEENNTGVTYQLYITVGESMGFNYISMEYQFYDSDTNFQQLFYNLTNESIQAVFNFEVTGQMPKMKVLDFLTGLFKMFNLIAYLENDVVVVKKLEDFYSEGNTYDITKYTDVSKRQVDAVMPFKEVDYSYQGLKTFFPANHEQLFNEDWGTEEYKGGGSAILAGSIFKQQVPFEHTKFERLIDLGTRQRTDVQWGWCVDDNQESYIGKPLLFYMNHVDDKFTDSISFVNDIRGTKDEPDFFDHKEAEKCFLPQNSNMDIDDVYSFGWKSINFKQEQDEWTAGVSYNSLFNNCHISYMTSVFDKTNRLFKLKAYLPLRIILKYKLNDIFIISGKKYRINSIETNLKNGETSLELLNYYEQIFNANYAIREVAFFTNHIFIDWNTFYGASSYNYSINGVVTNTTSDNANRLIGASETELVIFIQALDSSGNVLKTSNTMTIQV